MRFESIILILVVTLQGVVSPAANAVELTIAYDVRESFPNIIGNGTNIESPPGISLDILNEVAFQLNIDIKFVRYPILRIWYLMIKGDIDAAFIFSLTEERKNAAVYPMTDINTLDSRRRMARLDYHLYKLKESPIEWDGKNIIGLDGPVGIGRGNSIGKDLELMNIPVSIAKSVRHNVKKLIAKRITVIAEQNRPVNHILTGMGISNVERLDIPLSTKDYYLVFSKKFSASHPGLTENIWNTIGLVRDEITQQAMPRYRIPLAPSSPEA